MATGRRRSNVLSGTKDCGGSNPPPLASSSPHCCCPWPPPTLDSALLHPFLCWCLLPAQKPSARAPVTKTASNRALLTTVYVDEDGVDRLVPGPKKKPSSSSSTSNAAAAAAAALSRPPPSTARKSRARTLAARSRSRGPAAAAASDCGTDVYRLLAPIVFFLSTSSWKAK